MRISIHQPCYFGWLPYYQRIMASDIHIVLDHVQFEKGSFINRQKINGWLTVPVEDRKPIYEMKIDNSKKWWEKHRKTLMQTYKLPEDHLLIQHIQPVPYLNQLLRTQLDIFRTLLDIKTKIYYSSSLPLFKTKSDLVVEICQLFNATEYLSGPMGRDYLDEEAFGDIKILYDDSTGPCILDLYID